MNIKNKLTLLWAWNKMKISNKYHFSKHPKIYHELVLEGMKKADKLAAGNRAKFLELYDKYVKQKLLKDPTILYKASH